MCMALVILGVLTRGKVLLLSRKMSLFPFSKIFSRRKYMGSCLFEKLGINSFSLEKATVHNTLRVFFLHCSFSHRHSTPNMEIMTTPSHTVLHSLLFSLSPRRSPKFFIKRYFLRDLTGTGVWTSTSKVLFWDIWCSRDNQRQSYLNSLKEGTCMSHHQGLIRHWLSRDPRDQRESIKWWDVTRLLNEYRTY